jgi:hypothetical protein
MQNYNLKNIKMDSGKQLGGKKKKVVKKNPMKKKVVKKTLAKKGVVKKNPAEKKVVKKTPVKKRISKKYSKSKKQQIKDYLDSIDPMHVEEHMIERMNKIKEYIINKLPIKEKVDVMVFFTNERGDEDDLEGDELLPYDNSTGIEINVSFDDESNAKKLSIKWWNDVLKKAQKLLPNLKWKKSKTDGGITFIYSNFEIKE